MPSFRAYTLPSPFPVFQSFYSPEPIAAKLVPYLDHILSPDVKPVIIGGSGDGKGVVFREKGH